MIDKFKDDEASFVDIIEHSPTRGRIYKGKWGWLDEKVLSHDNFIDTSKGVSEAVVVIF